MSSVINTNTLSLLTQNNLTKSQSALNTSIQRLSSGLRINSAKDDAAGQAIANRFTANIKGLTQAQRNANDGISLAQTTEGALNEVNTNLQRIRELTVQSANGSNSAEDKASIQAEITQRLEEIDRTSAQTDFNGVKVLSSSAGKLDIQIGANDGESISIDLAEISSKTLKLDGFNVTGTATVPNKAATVTDLQAAGASNSGNIYSLTTTNKAVTADAVMAKLTNGNTVDVNDGTTTITYTFDAAKNNFKYDKEVEAADFSDEADALKPASGKISGSFENGTGGVSASFEVDAAGSITIGGQAAYLVDDGSGVLSLTANDASGSLTQATLEDVMTATSDDTAMSGATLKLAGRTYSQSATSGDLKYETTATTADVLSAIKTGTNTTAVQLGTGVLSATVNLDAAAAVSGSSTDTYVDQKGDLTTVSSYDMNYKVDEDNGKVTIESVGSAVGGSNPYSAADVGKEAFVNSSGKLTTETTSAGKATVDPLKALDAALSMVDKLRGSLGAVQNRFDSVISNLGSTITNLASSRSRIEDADYATEVSEMTRAQILQQAGTSVLSKANQSTQGVMSLLQ